MSGVPGNVREAIRTLVQYNWADEKRDYEEQLRKGETEPGDGHVFEHLQTVDAWLLSVEP